MRLTNKRKRALIGLSFIAIWLIGFIILTLIPFINSIIYSFNQVLVETTGIRLVALGFGNYKRILTQDIQFVNALIAFLSQLVLRLPIIIVFSIIIALLLNQDIKFRGLFRSIFFLPVIVTSGPIISELGAQGATTIPTIEESPILATIAMNVTPILAEPIVALFTQIIMVLWFSGVQILIFLSGLQKLDQQIYEAARIDGASPWESFWKVTLPALKNLIIINIIYTVVTLATFSENEVIALIRSAMFDPVRGYGYATAQAWLYFIVVFLVLAIAIGLVALSGRSKLRLRR